MSLASSDVALLCALVGLFILPWPPAGLSSLGPGAWSLHLVALGTCVAGHFYVFYHEPEHWAVALAVATLIHALLRQTWRHLFERDVEMANLILLCLAAIDVGTALIMWLGADLWPGACLMLGILGWDVFIFLRKITGHRTSPRPPDDIEAQRSVRAQPSAGVAKAKAHPTAPPKIPRLSLKKRGDVNHV